MCGIAGIVSFTGLSDQAPALAVAMRDELTHRGPDEAGLHCDRFAALGHRRLSIVDLATGHQPMCNEDGTIWIVFNGEIYNFAEIRADARGTRPSLPHALATPRSSSTPTRSGATRLRRPSSRHVRVRDLGRAAAGCCWCAIALASSRSTTRDCRTAVTFGSEIKCAARGPDGAARLEPRRARRLSDAAVRPCPRTIYRDSRSCRRAPAGRGATAASRPALLGPDVHRRRRRAREAEYLERLDAAGRANRCACA